jgi:hypothetical protein
MDGFDLEVEAAIVYLRGLRSHQAETGRPELFAFAINTVRLRVRLSTICDAQM